MSQGMVVLKKGEGRALKSVGMWIYDLRKHQRWRYCVG